MKKLLLLTLSAVLAGTLPSFAVQIGGNAPQVSAGQEAIDAAFNIALNQLNGKVANIKNRPQKMAKAFADAASFSNHAGTQRGYLNYENFALTAGTMAGFQVPGLSATEIQKLDDNILNSGDSKIGVGWQTWAVQLGINASFITDGLYLGLKFGQASLSLDAEDNEMKFKYITLGLTSSYSFIGEHSIGIIKWRGLAFATGLMYQKSTTDYILDLGTQKGTMGGAGAVQIASDLDFETSSTIWTVPVELNTAFRLFWTTNLHLGTGADICWGKTDLALKLNGDVNIVDSPLEQTKSGTVYFTDKVGVNGKKPSIIKPKLMAGLGCLIGPVVVDIPFTYYLGNGFDLGFTAGIIW